MSFNEVNQSSGELGQIAGSQVTTIYADAPLGAIVNYGGDTAPTGWLICDGSAVSRTTYADLYDVIGTKYGPGDGSTTFNLPDGEAAAAIYPTQDVGNGIAGSIYLIKAVLTALPSDIQTQIDGCAKLNANNVFKGYQTGDGAGVVYRITNIDLNDTPAQTVWGNAGIELKDVNDTVIGYMTTNQKTNGKVDVLIAANDKVLLNGIDVNEKLYPTPIIVPVSGTYGNIIKQVLNAIDISKITKDSVIVAFGIMFHYVGNFVNYHQFSAQIASPGEAKLLSITMAGTTSDGVYYHITSGANGTAFVDATTVSLSAQNVAVYY